MENSENADKFNLLLNYLPEENSSCLEINSGTGDVLEQLSIIFKNVFSFDPNSQNLKIQEKKFKEHKLDNIKILDQNFKKNNFTSNSLDLIIVNNIFDLISDDLTLKQLLLELKNLLKSNGCIIFLTKEQKLGFSNFPNLLESNLEKLNLKFYSNWILPSITSPVFLSKLHNTKTLNWFFKNLDNFIPSHKQKSIQKRFLLKLITLPNKSILNVILKIYSPPFLTYCTKKTNNSLETKILEKSNFSSSILMNRKFKTIFILFDDFGVPQETASINKNDLKNYFQNKITFTNFILKNVTFSKWKNGRILDPLNSNEILLAIDWIIQFQKDGMSTESLNNELKLQINSMKSLFLKHRLNGIPLTQWLKDYEIFIKNSTIYKTNIHGDLSHKNMLISNSKIIEAIDFEFYNNLGNPLDDILNFLFRYLIKSKDKTKVDSFAFKLSKIDKDSTLTLNNIEQKLSAYFNYDITVVFLMEIYFLRIIFTRIIQNIPLDDQLPYIQILSKISQ